MPGQRTVRIYVYLHRRRTIGAQKRPYPHVRKHPDCVFLCFTNATLIDESFADEMLKVGNFVPAISLEGSEYATDGRRGKGVYKKVQEAMSIFKEKKLVYGISSCYTSSNYESITSE